MAKFQRIAMMVPSISEKRVTFLLMEGLAEPLSGLVKVFSPMQLQDAIKRVLDLAPSMMRTKATLPPRMGTSRSMLEVGPPPTKRSQTTRDNKVSLDSRNELRKNNLCFNCKQPWKRGHRCLGKGQIHYIEVVLEDDDSDL